MAAVSPDLLAACLDEVQSGRKTVEECAAEHPEVAEELRDQGVLVGLTGKREDVLKIRPPLVFTDQHGELLVSALSLVLG